MRYAFMFCLILLGSIRAVPLENWRFPFFSIASDFEYSQGSPSRMFWDNISTTTLFDSSLWLPTEMSGENFWMFEPAVTGGVAAPVENTVGYVHADFYNNIRFFRFRVWQSCDVDTRYTYDPDYPAHRERSVRGLIEEAALEYDYRHGFLRIGRQKRNWGPFPDRSLLLSSNPYSYDAVEWQIHGRFFEFRHMFAPFPNKYATWDSDNGTPRDRYLTVHALNFMIGKWVTFGFFESVIFTRNRGIPDLQYVNPISIYSVINTNWEGNGNLMLGCQWNIHPFTEAISLRGQLVLDDFQVDDEIVTDQEPTHWGIDAGIFWRNPFPAVKWNHLLKLEYTYASEWLYTVPDGNADNGERYLFARKSLGLPFNDGSRLRLGAQVVPRQFGAFGISVVYDYHGGNTELSSWMDSESGNIRGLPVDTHAPVERRVAVGAEGMLYLKDYVHLYAGADLGGVRNRDNTRHHAMEFDPAVSAELSVHFSNLIVKLR